ncbi:MAG: GntR family transcriptional regulator [Atopobiaceae bacterium]|jgi:GntR family transcriptional regulator|nr:GntR family transcriptional regulator [Atopobiaceae bacterium]MCH4181189.1 GntR family transcriptional regulator [Atopobiaceae bacterium]MCH4214954.1 GntR family transcriptional regulator [Atopobiaceae bacterium]MCH4230687.1 GntR family transcriptional regulator [Atopobiaceae bacterium]MCH4277105.1 GntR family transcriptional regulator [Atopobiaceae bacterium]
MLKYESVVNDLKLKIEDGTFAANSQLPTVTQLCERYDVSKITIKKAMDELEQAGLISRRRGSGSFVKNVTHGTAEAARWEMSSQMQGFTGEHGSLGETVETKVYDFSVVCPPEDVARALGMDEDTFAYHVCRTRAAEGVIHCIEYTYMPIDVIPDLRRKNVETSIYTYIEKDLGLKISSAHRIVRASLPTPQEQERLEVGPIEPLLEVEQVGFLDDGVPFEWSISKHSHAYEFRSISTK